MRVLLLSIGSRGDVEPFCALARELLLDRDNQHDIDFFVEPNHKDLVQPLLESKEDDGSDHDGLRITIHYFPFENAGFIRITKPPSSSDTSGTLTDARQTITTGPPTFASDAIDNTAEIFRNTTFPCLDQVLQVAQHCDVIVSCNLTNILCILISDTLHAIRRQRQMMSPSSSSSSGGGDLLTTKTPKIVFLHLQPLAPNTIFPCYRTATKQEFCTTILDWFCGSGRRDVAGSTDDSPNGNEDDTTWESYWMLDRQLHHQLFGSERMHEGSLSGDPSTRIGPTTIPISWDDWKDTFSGNRSGYYIVNAYSKYLIPCIVGTSSRIGGNVVDVGPLADAYISQSGGPTNNVHSEKDDDRERHLTTTLQDEILSFCQSEDYGGRGGGRPLCIGFGSMSVPRSTIHAVYEALQELGYPKTILVGAALLHPSPYKAPPNRNVLHVVSVPYPWLLPFCSVMVCHGGMGVLQACLRAGIPAVVCPAMGDQYVNAGLVQGLGLGRQACSSLNRLTSAELVTALRDVLPGGDDGTTAADGERSGDRIRERCRRVAERIRSEPRTGAQRLADWLEENV